MLFYISKLNHRVIISFSIKGEISEEKNICKKLFLELLTAPKKLNKKLHSLKIISRKLQSCYLLYIAITFGVYLEWLSLEMRPTIYLSLVVGWPITCIADVWQRCMR